MSNSKQLFILRHGKAQSENFHNDESRTLTDIGVAEAQLSGQYFASLGITLDAVYVSPLIRAQETAQAFLSQIDSPPQPANFDLITPSGRPLDVALWLSSLKEKNVLLVTHQPFAYELIRLLADASLPAGFSMETGTIAALSGEIFATDCCTFDFFYTPTIGV